ncbi:MAG: alpha-galactosidase [Clostridia bacterium]|nr:alpha-galactosidase [Clostridia bacterium]
MRAIISLIQALLFIVSSFAVPDSNFKVWVDRAAMEISSTSDFSFDSIDASEAVVSQAEKELCRNWYEDNILTTENPAYTFKVGGRDFRRNIDKWDFSFSDESEAGEVYRGGKTTYITITHTKSSIVATVEATIYEENASCDWTVYVKNSGEDKSPTVSNLYAMDSVIPTGRKTKAYFSQGSYAEADDFETMKSKLALIPMVFSANGGRTESFLPYFNLIGEDCGAVLAVGWSGQWYTSLAQTIGGTKVEAKQETLKGYLLPGEEIRSPLVSLTFYDSDNAVKGFNSYRKYVVDCVSPEGTKQVATTGIGVEVAGTTEAQVLQNVKNIPDEWAASLDYAWVDAGWYPMTDGNWANNLGNWYADPARFPDGLGDISKALESRGMELLLWYEIERCCKGSEVYNNCVNNDGWMIVNEEDEYTNYINFANEECLEYITNYMLDSLRSNGVKCLRNDHNYVLLPFWEEADKLWADGRKGITENHYVTNLYKFFDTLLEEIPGLRIDNCASGGKRLDIEMSRRSIPLWRSDYNCMDGEGNSNPGILEATQAQTYGISFWYPYNGTCAYIYNEYADRTNIISCSQQLSYYDIRPYMVGNYYPLTYGGLDTEKYHAMQFDTDGKEGMALIYKRENVADNTYHLVLSGLESKTVYEVYDYDKPEVKHEYIGADLMEYGINLTITETPKAVIMLYKAK